MRKRLFAIVATAAITMLFCTVGIYAGTEVKDEIRMENKAYEKHTKSIHVFTHKKHMTEYAEKHPDLYKNGCGECHHGEKDGKSIPLNNLKEGDEVKNCIECHKIPGYIEKKEAKEKNLDEKQQRQYHGNAVHDNCQDCHKKYNEKMGLKSKDEGYAPTKSKCKTCHPKK